MKILKKFGVDKHFGVARLHKHYELQKGERVIWEKTEAGFVSSVKTTEAGFPLNLQWNKETRRMEPVEFHTLTESDAWKEVTQMSSYGEFVREFS